jgi:Na+/H+ antiporter NhaD/arsenite permease-like protein
VHQANAFNFHPIQEVAILFAGIFATMMPALDWLQLNASQMGQPSLSIYYWGSGILSSVLDNAPTYLAFLKAIFGATVDQGLCEQIHQLIQSGAVPAVSEATPIGQTFIALRKYHSAALLNKSVTLDEIQMAFLLGNTAFNKYIVAISIGAVFFGANTYIGNGPNFMVKAIADQNKVHTPSFIGYIFGYSVPFMLPTLFLIWWLFFRN